MRRVAALLVVARIAAADGDADADRAFRDALARQDIAALEQIGAARPLTRWNDDAWAEAARLAVRAQDLERARADLAQVIAIGDDPQLVRRAQAELDRLASFAGSAGEWTAVAAEHERLEPELHRAGDPRSAIARLEQLVRAHPRYPRAPMVMIAIAQAWEREGDADRAVAWLAEAKTAATTRGDRQRAMSELTRTLIRRGDLGAAAREIDELSHEGMFVASLRQQLKTARLRRVVHIAMWAVLVVLATITTVALRRGSGSWRGALRRLARPPAEAMFMVPIGAVLIAIALTGNPLVAHTVIGVVVAGIVTSWCSGAILAGTRPTLRRAALHVALCVVAVAAATYIAVDRGHVIDLLIETWREGPAR